ncbi:TatD family hydrolase [uncultured Methanobrevibacter sp.]|uniref:TatD family hydrolase n=1 Tax=uncultured Methanobrevibacter sp. TaxID=253161 RepID=UPI00260432A4
MIDTHCHIDFDEFDSDREEVISRAREKLNAIVNSGYGLESNEKALALSKKYEGFVYPTFGFHPVSSQNSPQEEIDAAHKQMIDHLDEILAVGEVGMDFFYCTDKAMRLRPQEIFMGFVEIANEYKKPLLIHGRDCERKIFNLIQDYDDIPKVIFHCYGGSLKTARRMLDKDNYYISCSTMVCYSQRHQELFREIPIERILTETDSPYLAMTKDERNEPLNVQRAVNKLAELQDLDVAYVDETTEKNARKVFGI